MAKNDNKELHSILEQLKKSYSEVNGSLDVEDEVSEPTIDASDDFQKLLTNFFSTDFVEEKNEDTYNFNVIEEKVEYNDETEEDISVEAEESAENEEIEESAEVELIEEIEESVEVEEIVEIAENVETEEDLPWFEESIKEDISAVEESVDDGEGNSVEAKEYIEENIEVEEIEDIIEEEIEVEETENLVEEDVEAEEVIEDIEIQEPLAEAGEDNIEDTPSLAAEDTDVEEKAPTITENILAQPINKVGRDEVTAVENVFRIMFGAKQTQSESEISREETVDEPQDAYYEDYPLVYEEEKETTTDADEYFEDTADIPTLTVEEFEEDIEEFPNSYREDDEDEEYEEDIAPYVSSPILEYEDEDLTPVAYMDDVYEEEEKEPYRYDPLQGHLSDAAYLVHKSVDEKLEFNTRQREIDLDDDDISLLLDFGYDDEIKSEAGAGRTNEIKRQKKNSVTLEKSERILGYSGEEYMGHAQDKAIKNKYASDKKKIIVRISLIAAIAVFMLGASIFYHAGVYVDNSIYPYIEAMAILISAVVAAPGLIEGAREIAKLDPKNYSIPVFLMIVQLAYDLFVIILQLGANPSDGKLMTCGFLVICSVAVSLMSDALECSAQTNTFEVVSSDGRIYSAEKFIKPKNDVNDKNSSRTISSDAMLGNCIYRVKETDIAHGYFSRMSKKSDKCLRIMYFMGILPIVALIMGCVSLIESGDTYVALSSVMTVMFMGFPISFTLFRAIPYFYMTKNLMADKCAIVGDVSGCDYKDVDMIMFDDVDAVKVTESIEIRPEGNPDVASAIKIASRAFKALGGPLSRILATEPDEDEASVNIVSIRDNGIEFYMDSYLHVVVGDKNFMSIHGMKVSSDKKIISSSSDNKATAVLYVAFNGVPQLGYIVSSKINEEFSNTIKNLAANGIKTAVATYSPLLNDYYFEAHKPEGVASAVVHKPTVFEPKDKTYFVDGGMFAIGEPTKIANTVIEAKKYLKNEFQNKRFSTMMAVFGILLGIITVIFTAIVKDGVNMGIFSCVLILIFNAVSVFGIIFKHLDLKSKMKRR